MRDSLNYNDMIVQSLEGQLCAIIEGNKEAANWWADILNDDYSAYVERFGGEE